MLHKKHYSLQEASELLMLIKPKLKEIIELKNQLDSIGFDIYNHQYFGGRGPNGTGEFPPEMEKLIFLFEEITSKGVLIKGIDNGLIDFPHINSYGEEVYLCYLYGEEKIMYWHRIEDGFKGRKKIDEI